MAPRLNYPGDWELWNHIFQCLASAAGLWEKIDPDAIPKEPFLTAPERPSVGNYEKKRLVTRAGVRSHGTRASSTSAATEEDSATVEEPDLSGTLATHINELTQDGLSCLELDWTIYATLDEIYNNELKQIYTLKVWMLETVSTHLLTTCCAPRDGIDDWYKKLKERVGPI